MLANFSTGVETKTFGSSELKKKNERVHFFSSDLSILISCYYLKQAHLEACKFKIVNCTNKNCDATVKRRDLEQHTTNTCEWRIIECEYCEYLNPKKHVEVNVTKLNRLFSTSRILQFMRQRAYVEILSTLKVWTARERRKRRSREQL